MRKCLQKCTRSSFPTKSTAVMRWIINHVTSLQRSTTLEIIQLIEPSKNEELSPISPKLLCASLWIAVTVRCHWAAMFTPTSPLSSSMFSQTSSFTSCPRLIATLIALLVGGTGYGYMMHVLCPDWTWFSCDEEVRVGGRCERCQRGGNRVDYLCSL